MRFASYLLFLGLWALRTASADACNPQDLHGAYGLHLSGFAAVSGALTPAVVVGRLVFESGGKVTGESSANFNGLLLGNPVTGQYEFTDDCTLTMVLQDTSGALQHFEGYGTTGANEIQLEQTDTAVAASGMMQRASDKCTVAALQGKWVMSVDATTTSLAVDPVRRRFSARAVVSMDGSGGLQIGTGQDTAFGAYRMDEGCVVQFEIGNAHLRGVLVGKGNEIFAIQTDPTQLASVRFTAQ